MVFHPVIIANLANSSAVAVDRIRELGNAPGIPFIQADVADSASLDDIFGTHQISAVIHFAGLKAVGESVARPLRFILVSETPKLWTPTSSPILVFNFSSSPHRSPMIDLCLTPIILAQALNHRDS